MSNDQVLFNLFWKKKGEYLYNIRDDNQIRFTWKLFLNNYLDGIKNDGTTELPIVLLTEEQMLYNVKRRSQRTN